MSENNSYIEVDRTFDPSTRYPLISGDRYGRRYDRNQCVILGFAYKVSGESDWHEILYRAGNENGTYLLETSELAEYVEVHCEEVSRERAIEWLSEHNAEALRRLNRASW